jgi:hypothetical protein
MAGIFAFRCAHCDELHEGSPSFGFNAPDHYANLSDEQKNQLGWLSDDLCTITHGEHTDFFIRTVLNVPIHGVSEPFCWGIWVSVSPQSYDRYVATYDAPVEGDGFFGWVCNAIPGYPNDTHLAANVLVQLHGLSPKLHLQTGEGRDHPLIADQHNGISVQKAQELAEFIMHQGSSAQP